jgi:phytoene dehydrogenase-like protein
MKPEAAAQPLHNPGPPLSVEEGNERLTALSSLDRDGLVAEWQAVFRHPAPRGAQVNLLRGALASKCQLDADDRGKYKKLSRQLRYWTAHAQVVALQPGARLLREWKGITHQVTVLDKGFDYDGQTYRSLTAITKRITGMGWSGPQFFGLRK